MELKQNQIINILYKKDNQETPEERVIVPTYVPPQVVKAIDVADLPAQESEELVALLREYQEYYSDHINKALNFEGWVEQTKNKTIIPKWRSFKLSNIIDSE
jgi:hypothetical protein